MTDRPTQQSNEESESGCYQLDREQQIPPRNGTVEAGCIVTEVLDGWSLGPYLKRVSDEDGRTFIVDVSHLSEIEEPEERAGVVA